METKKTVLLFSSVFLCFFFACVMFQNTWSCDDTIGLKCVLFYVFKVAQIFSETWNIFSISQGLALLVLLNFLLLPESYRTGNHSLVSWQKTSDL